MRIVYGQVTPGRCTGRTGTRARNDRGRNLSQERSLLLKPSPPIEMTGPMTSIDHPYFGHLEVPPADGTEVIWEGTAALGSSEVEVRLWADPGSGLDAGELDAFATHLDRLPALDTAARAAIRKNLQQDRYFIDHHADELDDIEVIKRLAREANGEAIGVDAFTAAMRPVQVGLWHLIGEDEARIVMDYTIDAATSDELLAVKVARDGTVASVDWES
ncbi:DUF2004 domain-containing protein [Streptomyces sp. NPDC057575]|uniref:DUF2004 domain-containing protein n=1 Tax=unclassified Streptomyces TaxID=2593676 RepID=UPI0036A4151F